MDELLDERLTHRGGAREGRGTRHVAPGGHPRRRSRITANDRSNLLHIADEISEFAHKPQAFAAT
jgi:hypothetical protein